VRKEVGRRYAEHEKAEALQVLAGSKSYRDAETKLKLLWGDAPAVSTLVVWKRDEPEVWQRAQQMERAEREGRIRATRQQVKETSAVVALGALERVHEQMEAGADLDFTKIAKEAMVAHGIASDKDALDDGRPTQIVQHKRPEEILRLLREHARPRRDYDAEGAAEDD
jgi:hypothetical protein